MRLISTLALIVAAGSASAQDAGWDYKASLYLWVPGISTSVETQNFGTVEADVSPSDAIAALDMAFMGTFAAQKGPWIFVGDLLYTDLSATNRSPRGVVFNNSTVSSELTAFTAYALYDFNAGSDVQVALGGGFRYFGLNLGLQLNGVTVGPESRVNRSDDSDWVVPVIAAKVYAPIDEKWFVNGLADWGMNGDDEETWQVYAGVGYKFNEKWSTQIGYRYMDLTTETSLGDTSLDLSGVLLGATFSF